MMKFRIANREISEETTQTHVKGFFNWAVGQAESRNYNLHGQIRVCVCVCVVRRPQWLGNKSRGGR